VTLIEIQENLRQQVRSAALELFGVELGQLNAETPPRPQLGDLAFPVAFELAKLIKLTTGAKLAPKIAFTLCYGQSSDSGRWFGP